MEIIPSSCAESTGLLKRSIACRSVTSQAPLSMPSGLQLHPSARSFDAVRKVASKAFPSGSGPSVERSEASTWRRISLSSGSAALGWSSTSPEPPSTTAKGIGFAARPPRRVIDTARAISSGEMS